MDESESCAALIPLIQSREKFVRLMSSFRYAFDLVETPSFPSPLKIYRSLEDNASKLEERVGLIQERTDKAISQIASNFIASQKSIIYNNLIQEFLNSKKKCEVYLQSELNVLQKNLDDLIENNSQLAEKKKTAKNEIHSLKKTVYFENREILKQLNDTFIEMTNDCVSYQVKMDQISSEILEIFPKSGKKKEEIKELITFQSSLRSKLSTLNSHIKGITDDCAALSIDIDEIQADIINNEKKLEVKKLELTIETDNTNQILKRQENMKIEIEEKQLHFPEILETNLSLEEEIRKNKEKLAIVQSSLPHLEKQLNDIQSTQENELNLEKKYLTTREAQLDTLISKKMAMIVESGKKINRKRERGLELHEIFEMRKLMLITALDDIGHKLKKAKKAAEKLQKRAKIGDLVKRRWKARDIASVEMRGNSSAFATPQMKRTFSKLFPNVVVDNRTAISQRK